MDQTDAASFFDFGVFKVSDELRFLPPCPPRFDSPPPLPPSLFLPR